MYKRVINTRDEFVKNGKRRKKNKIRKIYYIECVNKRNNRLFPAPYIHPPPQCSVIECCDFTTHPLIPSAHRRCSNTLFLLRPNSFATAAASASVTNPWANLSNARATRYPRRRNYPCSSPASLRHSFPLTYYNIFNNPMRPQKRDPFAYSSYY